MSYRSAQTSYAIGAILPPHFQKILSQFTFGLSNAHWFDPSFYHICFRYLGSFDNATVIDIANSLNAIHYPPFFLTFKGPATFPCDRETEILGISIASSVDVQKIKSLIQSQLHPLKISQEKKSLPSYIPLGMIERNQSDSVQIYTHDKADWTYTPFLVKSLALLQIQRTKKNIFYEILKEYPLIAKGDGE